MNGCMVQEGLSSRKKCDVLLYACQVGAYNLGSGCNIVTDQHIQCCVIVLCIRNKELFLAFDS